MDPTLLVAQSILDPHQASLAALIERSWGRWMSLPAENRAILNTSDRTRAGVIWSFIINEANEYFHDHGIIGLKEYGTVTYRVSPLVRLRFKKMNQDGLTRNYPTHRACTYNDQLPLPECPEPIRVDVGYVLNDLKTGIDQILASCPNGSGARWVYALTPSVTVLPLFPDVEQEEMRRSLVRPRTPDEITKKEAIDGTESP